MPTAQVRIEDDLDKAQWSWRQEARARHVGDRLDLDVNRLPLEGGRGNEKSHKLPTLGSDWVDASDRNPPEIVHLPGTSKGPTGIRDLGTGVTCFSCIPSPLSHLSVCVGLILALCSQWEGTPSCE